MKRDLEVMRELLLKIEAHPGALMKVGELVATDFERYQIELLAEAGFVRIVDRVGNSNTGPGVPGLARFHSPKVAVTNQGHDYLDAIKNEGVWAKTREIVAQEGGNVAMEIVKSIALGFARKQIEDRTGIKL